jgi:hypothetical protein
MPIQIAKSICTRWCNQPVSVCCLIVLLVWTLGGAVLDCQMEKKLNMTFCPWM